MTRLVPSAAWLVLFNALVAAALCGVCAVMLLEMRREIDERAKVTASSLVTLMARDIARNVELYDLSLRGIVDGMKEQRVREADPELRHMILFDRAATATNFGLIALLDSAGSPILTSRPMAPFTAQDREYFQHHLRDPSPDLLIGKPILSRSSGRWGLPLSRRLSHPDGGFAGVVVGVIFLDHFAQLFATAGLQAGDAISLLARDGTVLLREPGVGVGTNVAQSPSFLTMRASREGLFDGTAMIGQDQRRFAFAQVGDAPLIVSLSVPLRTIYAAWWRKAITLGGIVLTLCGATLVLTALLRRELIQRRKAEEATARLNDELRQLAITDPLTGLNNRRRFDEVLARDLRRAQRTGHPLALILLDADAFKAFNDRYGHQHGDTALRMIAEALVGAAGRPGATLCRIGGEEFAAILPETTRIEAEAAARRIRVAVAAGTLPHAASPHGVVTVSLGVACLSPNTGSAQSLVAAADAALYEAKGEGRNTHVMAPPAPLSGPRAA
ncbi:sensor domain-containing diguanylate cyclase [Methylobacterium sp. J-078]|uniref:sensor domain-containing diguanylate cyclase n=1 Tax=Methylobacterium sp. J-078 TaxID=2836657 RepID=UPI001FBACF40|nr:sensor domain-containing diguanylate cyclase [Methylobacterium sp. J-078]MCJ2047440.1 sensor domain-containing diguanylate cyclase [Methylobacterium sp. J-078]